MFDYGARGYYPASMRFTTMDPLAEKYYSISPYVYCLNNPVRFVDPDGRKVSLTGEYLMEIINSLATTTNINLHWDSNSGYLTYTTTEDVEYSVRDKELMKIIDDEEVEVRLRGLSVDASYTNRALNYDVPEGSVYGGAFEGSTVKNNYVLATQSIDYTTIINTENAGLDKAGTVVGHELFEAYYGAKNYPGINKNSSKKEFNKAYIDSHTKSFNFYPVLMHKVWLMGDGSIWVSLNGLAPTLVRPPKSKKP